MIAPATGSSVMPAGEATTIRAPAATAASTPTRDPQNTTASAPSTAAPPPGAGTNSTAPGQLSGRAEPDADDVVPETDQSSGHTTTEEGIDAEDDDPHAGLVVNVVIVSRHHRH